MKTKKELDSKLFLGFGFLTIFLSMASGFNVKFMKETRLIEQFMTSGGVKVRGAVRGGRAAVQGDRARRQCSGCMYEQQTVTPEVSTVNGGIAFYGS